MKSQKAYRFILLLFSIVFLKTPAMAQTNLNIRSDGTIIYDNPPDLDSTYKSEHFIIKYSLLTSDTLNGVPPTDNNQDGIPDFVNTVITAVENVYDKYLDSTQHTNYVKFNPPPFRTSGGSYYYVYIFNISKDMGLTQPVRFYGDNPWTDLTEKNSVASLLYINNKIENLGKPEFTPEQKIKLTIAHEFFHVIQNGYDAYSSSWLMEATATWSESYIYPDIGMNKNLVADFMKNSSIPLNAKKKDNLNTNLINHWYSGWIFFQYLNDHDSADIIQSIFYYVVDFHDSQYDSSDVSIESINKALINHKLSNTDFGTAFNNFAIANYVKNIPPYNYQDPSLIPDFKYEWFLSYITGYKSRHYDIHRLSTNYHRVALPRLGNTPVKITFSEPNDDSIKASVYTVSGQSRNITPLIKDKTLTIDKPSSFNDIVIIVTNYSKADAKSPLGGTELKTYLLDIDVKAPLILIKDFQNSNVSNLYNFSCNDEASMWVEENYNPFIEYSTVYLTERFHTFGPKRENSSFGENYSAFRSRLSIENDELVYAYDHYYGNQGDSVIIWATSDKFAYSVPVLHSSFIFPDDLVNLAINDKKVYYNLNVSNFPTKCDVWKYNLISKKRVKISNMGEGPDREDRNFIATSDYLVWDRWYPKWEWDGVREKALIARYKLDDDSLKVIFVIISKTARIELFSASGKYVAWTYLMEDKGFIERRLVIYDVSTGEFHDIYNFDGSQKLSVKNERVVFYDSTGTNLMIWSNGNIVKIIEGVENTHFYLGDQSVGWTKLLIEENGYRMAFYTQNLETNEVKSYTTESYPEPRITDLGYTDGIFYYLKTDGVSPLGLYKLNMNSVETGTEENDISSSDKNSSLLTNYPNPFAGSTTIAYKLPESGNVSLTVYDLTGRKVATPVNRKQQPGEYQIRFNASGLANGVYTIKLTVNGRKGYFTETKKMILYR